MSLSHLYWWSTISALPIGNRSRVINYLFKDNGASQRWHREGSHYIHPRVNSRACAASKWILQVQWQNQNFLPNKYTANMRVQEVAEKWENFFTDYELDLRMIRNQKKAVLCSLWNHQVSWVWVDWSLDTVTWNVKNIDTAVWRGLKFWGLVKPVIATNFHIFFWLFSILMNCFLSGIDQATLLVPFAKRFQSITLGWLVWRTKCFLTVGLFFLL